MKILKLVLITTIILVNFYSCSYQKMNLSNQKFTIEKIEINGDKRTSFLIERKIRRFSQENSPKGQIAEEHTSIHVGDPSPGPSFAISTLKTARHPRPQQPG